MELFADVPDSRDPRGVRVPLATVLTLAQTAVLAGARTLLAIAEWTIDADREVLFRIGISAKQALPSESRMRRTLVQLDADDLDARLAGWLTIRVCFLGGQRIIAYDGKTMRGTRTTSGAPHLIAAFDHAADAVVGQLAVSAKSNEYRPCGTCWARWRSPTRSTPRTPCTVNARLPPTSPPVARTTS